MDVYKVLLDQESIRGERTAWIFRWILYGISFLLAAVIYFVQQRPIVGLYGMVLSFGAISYNILLTRFILRNRTSPWIRYVSVTVDIVALTLYNMVDTIFTSTLVPVTTSTLVLYPLLIFLASLRLDRALIIYSTLLSAVAMNVLWGFAYPHFDPSIAGALVSADILGEVYRTLYIVVGGLLMLFIPGTITRLLKNQRDVFEKNRDNYELAHRDNLTGLSNRRMLDEHLPQQLARANLEMFSIGLLYLDLDEFKPVNDSFGHDVGDLVLIEAGRRLTSAVRDDDMVARVGGDEFVVVLNRVEGKKNCQFLSQRIKASFAQDFLVDGKVIKIGVSIGSALYPIEAKSATELIEKADKEMLKQKKQKR